MKYFLISIQLFCVVAAAQVNNDQPLPAWQKGFLDIHHINTGRGNAAFMLFPDGTSLLFDAGDLPVESFQKKNAPLKVVPAYPDSSLTPAQWIARYIRQVVPRGHKQQLDYAVVSHFHADHYGALTEVNNELPIRYLIDRGISFPTDLAQYYRKDSLFTRYLRFGGTLLQQGATWRPLQAGTDTQIVLKYNRALYPSFAVRNIKANGRIWSGQGHGAYDYFSAGQVLDKDQHFNENPLSLALKISYGRFDYFTGGDNTGLQGYGLPLWFDVETPVAKATGPVDVLTLDHHGNRDANNAAFLATLQPAVVVQQLWCSDQPGQEVLHRLISGAVLERPPAIFSTNMHEETKVYIGPWLTRNYKSTEGHILIRVTDGGTRYTVYILQNKGNELRVAHEFGPYESRW